MGGRDVDPSTRFSVRRITLAWGLLLLLLTCVLLLLAAGDAVVPLAVRPVLRERTLLRTCRGARGRGVAHYLALPPPARVVGAGGNASVHPGDHACVTEERFNERVTHCCAVAIKFQGRSGNRVTQYVAARMLLELQSCASPFMTLFSVENSNMAEMGDQGDFRSEHRQWPPVGGRWWPGGSDICGHPEAFNAHSGNLDTAVLFTAFPEHSDWMYSALSFAWDLAGGSLVGAGLRGSSTAVMPYAAVAERSTRWAVHREACAAAGIDAALHAAALANASLGVGSARGGGAATATALHAVGVAATREALHPWLPSRVAEEVEQLLQGTAPGTTPALRDFLADPDGTVVIHVRLEDIYEGAYRNSIMRSQGGLPRGYRDWLGPPRHDLGSMPSFVHAQPAELLEALEASAALVSMSSVPSVSFYRTVLRATQSVWRRVLIVGNSQLLGSPLFNALKDEFGATLQSGSEARDMAVLLLARQLVLSGGSTFSYMAAAQGRARVIHAPHVGLMRLRTDHGSALVVPSHFDARWVYHDIHRGAVSRIAAGFAAQAAAARAQGLTNASTVTRAWALNASRGVWDVHVEWLREPLALPPRELDPACPADDAETFGARGLAIALGASHPLPPHLVPLPASMPRYFLTYDELAAFHAHPPCTAYYFPSHVGQGLNTEGAHKFVRH